MTDPNDLADLAEVIPLRAKHDALLDFGVIVHGPGGCYRHHPVVNFSERRITCKKCEKALDPYDVLADYIRQWGRVRQTFREEAKARERLAELLRKERNVKARIRAAEKKEQSCQT